MEKRKRSSFGRVKQRLRKGGQIRWFSQGGRGIEELKKKRKRVFERIEGKCEESIKSAGGRSRPLGALNSVPTRISKGDAVP